MAKPRVDEGLRWGSLMAAAQNGSQEAYRELLEELLSVIRGYCQKRLGGSGLVEDCVQECLLAVHKARHTYDPRRPFEPWLFAIVRNKLIDQVRAEKRRSKHASGEELDEADRVGNLLSPEAASGFKSWIASLPELYRAPLILTKLYGFTSEEAARKLEISTSALKVRVHRGLRMLKKELHRDEEGL